MAPITDSPRTSARPVRASAVMAVAAVSLAGIGLLAPQLFPGRVPHAVSVVFFLCGLVMMVLALVRWGSDACDAASPRLRRRYSRELALAMGLYVVVLFASMSLLRLAEDTWLRALLALAPVPPIALAVRAMIRYVRDADEMQRRIELEAISMASAGVSMLYMTGGFLQSAKVIDVPSDVAMIWVFPLMCFAYGLAKAVVARRYR